MTRIYKRQIKWITLQQVLIFRFLVFYVIWCTITQKRKICQLVQSITWNIKSETHLHNMRDENKLMDIE